MRDPYEILGLNREAGEAEIKSAYRRLAKQWHPDRNASDPRAKDRFAELNSAYEILGDAQKKIQFDRGEIDAEGKPRFRPESFTGGARGDFEEFRFGSGPGRPFGGHRTGKPGRGPADIFSDLFSGAFREAPGRGDTLPKGEDIQTSLTLTLEEIAHQDKMRLALPGRSPVDVAIPKGVSDGQIIRLKGLGENSPYGGENGDVLLRIIIVPHDVFRTEGSDLRLDLPVDLADAVLGGMIRVPTLTGQVEMRIPSMTSSGKVLRLRGKGLPDKGSTKGDLLVTILIRLPDTPDDALQDYARRRRESRED
jgi:DnaJ-class molecular chaperone